MKTASRVAAVAAQASAQAGGLPRAGQGAAHETAQLPRYVPKLQGEHNSGTW